MMEVINGVDQN